MALQIDTSGTLLLQQVGSDVQYKSLDDSSWTDISAGQWPVTLNNTYTSNTLEVQFTTDLSFNLTTQYFIIDSSNITIDGLDNVVNVNINTYPGLIQNGTGSNANSDITIRNVGVESTNTLADRGGWIGQRYFGNGATDNYVTNCYSTGNIGFYAGGILGQLSSGSISNCYSTGTIGQYSGGIFGNSSSGSATNCYSIGDMDQGAGGIFGSESLASASATNCYSMGTISGSAGGIFGNSSSGLATNCYSRGNINNIDVGFTIYGAGGIFGDTSRAGARASNCYSTGPISRTAGGIFGRGSLGSAINCYSIGDIGYQAGGIFGNGSPGSATNCYSIGDISGGSGIGGSDPSYCYFTDGSTNWLDSNADASLNPLSAWTDIDLNSTNVPYLLSAFTSTLYSPSSATDASNSGISVLTDCSFSIVSVNGLNPSLYPDITIDTDTGDISFNLLSLQNGVYEVNVLATNTNTNDGYSFGTFTNSSTNPIDASGSVLVKQDVGSDVEYSLDAGTNWTTAVWPVTLNNTYTANTLEVTFTTDLSLNSADQYFIIDSSNITIDGSDNTVNIDISGAGYPGLVRNGTYSYSGGNITASNNAYSDITIQNIIIDSHSSSLLAIAPQTTTSGSNANKYGNGWLCQAYFGLDGSNNIIDNCSSNGPTYTIYWVDASGDTHSDNTNSTRGGCILGDLCNADATNCYSTGYIDSQAGGIFGSGSSSQAQATNCYSIGDIGEQAGGIFGPGSSGSATNCYSIGLISGTAAGGIFGSGSQGSATNCYSIGTIDGGSGGIFGGNSQGSATNCYSTGTIDGGSGGIFGQNSNLGSATNCYSIGVISGGSGGIFAPGTGRSDPSYCYSTDGSANWSDTNADASLNIASNAWTDIDLNSDTVPYLLSSFYLNQTLYDPSSGTNVVTKTPDISGNYTWSITSVNGSTSGNAEIAIDGSNGEITFGSLQNGVYEVNVVAVDSFGIYSFETFTNNVTTIDASGSVLVKQDVGSDVQYSLDAGTNWTTAVWPVTLNNTDTSNTLEVTFTTDLSLNSADQYFIIDSSNITIDGSDNTVNIDISGAGYPGLVRNGTYSYSGGNITANNDAYSDITIQNIIIDSHSSSLLAIAPTTSTQTGADKYGNGWLCQAYFGLGGSNNNVDNCSSNGSTFTTGYNGTIYWVDASGTQYSTNRGRTSGGCILGDFCDANATNCYSTGDIGVQAGGIFGQSSSSQAQATNCYSTGPTIGSNAGGIFGPNSQGSAINCYSTGTIGLSAGGIFGDGSQGSATNCYSTGTTIGQTAGGIFGGSSQGSATNCYSIGPIGRNAGGIFGEGSSGSASNCYSIGDIGGAAGGIFGRYSSGSATNCYSIGDIDGGGGGIFGESSSLQAQAINCYSIGTIGGGAGGIFGNSSSGSATNCYSIGLISGGSGIGGSDPSYCYFTDGSTNWLDSAADASLNIASNAWTDIDENSTNVPYLLSSFTSTLYNPSSATDASNSGISIVTDCSFSIVSVNGLDPSLYSSGITIDVDTGIIDFNSLQNGVYEVNVLATNANDGYSFGTFANSITTIDASGTVLLRQDAIDGVQYSTDDGITWTNAIWPVSLVNSGSSAPGTRSTRATGVPLSFTFTTDLSLNSADQYFIIDSSNIIVDGLNHIVNIDISGAGYPGLFQNGTYYYDVSGFIIASNDAYSDITIQNIIIDSHSSSLLAIQKSIDTISNFRSNGWLCQAFFGVDASANSIDNCSSNGTTYTSYWVDTNGDLSNNITTIVSAGGCILGDFCKADVTNCYSTGTIGSSGGGIFGAGSSGSAINCYSTGDIDIWGGGIIGTGSQVSANNCYSTGSIGISAGGIYGQFGQGIATNCYSSGDMNAGAGGIFGNQSSGSATNCYSTGSIDALYAGGIFGYQSTGSATNCYSTGVIDVSGQGIGVTDASYCYYTDGSTNWLDSAADASLNPLNAWTDIDLNSTNVPYRLTSFYINQILYDPSSGENVPSPERPDISGNYTWSITSVNGSTSGQAGITIDPATGDISFTSLSAASYAVNVLAEDSFGNYSFETFTNIISNICFPAGTPIVTNQGIIAIHKINPAIHTIRNKKIVAITKTVSPDKYLVRFEKDALGTNLPCEATTMTKNHMLFYKGEMMKAKEFLKTHNEFVSKVPYKGTVLYNVLLEEHDKMVVNNLICETLHPDNYVAQMYRAFRSLTPKQRVEAIQKVNKVVLTEGIYKKPSAKR